MTESVYLVLRSFNLGERLPWEDNKGGAFPLVEIHSIWNDEEKAKTVLEEFKKNRSSAQMLKVPLNEINPFKGLVTCEIISPERRDD